MQHGKNCEKRQFFRLCILYDVCVCVWWERRLMAIESERSVRCWAHIWYFVRQSSNISVCDHWEENGVFVFFTSSSSVCCWLSVWIVVSAFFYSLLCAQEMNFISISLVRFFLSSKNYVSTIYSIWFGWFLLSLSLEFDEQLLLGIRQKKIVTGSQLVILN